MGNYIGYFYPLNFSLNKDPHDKLRNIDLSSSDYDSFTNIYTLSPISKNSNKIRTNATSFLSSSTDDSFSFLDDNDTDKTKLNTSLYIEFPVQNLNKFPQNIFYYDWDDTLFFTSTFKQLFYEYCGNYYTEKYKTTNENLLLICFQKEIVNLDMLVSQILSQSLAIGNVYIVTNSTVNWVYEIAKEYYVRTNIFINSGKVKVISARDKYGKYYPRNRFLWKKKTFIDIVNEFDINKETNIISLGDGQCDIDATLAASKKFKQCLIKIVKFRERPTFDELKFQLEEYLFMFNDIIEKNQNYKCIL